MIKVYQTAGLFSFLTENDCADDRNYNHYYTDTTIGNSFINGTFFRLQDYGATDVVGVYYIYSDNTIALLNTGTNLWDYSAFDSNGNAYVWFNNADISSYPSQIRIVYELDNGFYLTTPFIYPYNCETEGQFYLLRSNNCDYDCDGNYFGVPYDINGDPIPEPPNPLDNWKFRNEMILRCKRLRLPDTYQKDFFNNCVATKIEKTKHIALETSGVPEWLMDSLGSIFDCGTLYIQNYMSGIDTSTPPNENDKWILKTEEPFSEARSKENCSCYFELQAKLDSCTCTIYPNCNDTLQTLCEGIELEFVSSTCLNTNVNGLCIESELVYNVLNPNAFPLSFGTPYADVLANNGLVNFSFSLVGTTLTVNITRVGNTCKDVLFNIVLPIAECDNVVLENQTLPPDMVRRCLYIRENVVLFAPSATTGSYDIDITYQVDNSIAPITNTITYSTTVDITDTFPNENKQVLCIDKQLGDGFFEVSIISFNVYNYVDISASSNIVPIVRCEDI